MYYLHTKAAVDAIKFTVDVDLVKRSDSQASVSASGSVPVAGAAAVTSTAARYWHLEAQ